MEPLSILALELTPKIGSRTIEKVLSLCPTFMPNKPSDIIDALNNAKKIYNKIIVPDIQTATRSFNNAHEVLRLSQQHHIKLISKYDANYPKSLLNIPDPPILLHVLGNIDALNQDCIAIIGTRRPSEFGINTARRLGASLAKKGYVIVSGLAEGIDSAAHQGALDVNGITVAVLAHGLDRIYPAKNKKLANDIIKHNGALISEYSWGSKIFRNYFVARDRIQSGLSLGVTVVETGIEGGTMNTVRFCKDQGRTLIVFKHPLELDSRMLGNDMLISKNLADVVIENNDIYPILNATNYKDCNKLYIKDERDKGSKTAQQMKFNLEG